MSESVSTLPRFDLQRLAEAVAELVADDLDDLYGQRMLNPPVQIDGPELDAVLAANNIAYLSSRLLPQILRYQSSMIRLREEQARKALQDLQDHPNDDIPF
jgi:hypothetical protein